MIRYHSASRKRFVGLVAGSASSLHRNRWSAFHSNAYCQPGLRRVYYSSVSGQDHVVIHELGSRFSFLGTTRGVMDVDIQLRLRLCTNFVIPLSKKRNGRTNQCRFAVGILRWPRYNECDTKIN